MTEARLFDLNIEKILEAWESAHAVRELIANAIDEQQLSETGDIQVFKTDDGDWVIRDFGRGVRYEHFTQNENAEKLQNAGKVMRHSGRTAYRAPARCSERTIACWSPATAACRGVVPCISAALGSAPRATSKSTAFAWP